MPPRRRNERNPKPESLLRLAERLDLLNDPQIQKLTKAAAVTDNTSLQRKAEKALAAKATQRHAHPFDHISPTVRNREDRITLGVTPTGGTYDLQQDDLTKHLLAVGQSGAGKTTLFYNLVDQLSVPFWSFDLKQDYRHLVQHRDDLVVLPWTQLKFNPLQPPEGVRPRRWIQVVSEIFGHATSLLSGSKNYLMKQLVKLYQLYGLLDAVEPPYPSLLELQLLLEHDNINYVRKTSNYRDTVLNRVEAMNRTAGSIFDCSRGHPIPDLLERNVVFELDGLGEDVQNFLMEALIAHVYEHRMAHDHRGGDLRHAFLVDEGKRVFSVYKERQDAAGVPTIDELTAKMREFGEGLVVADQEASKLTDSIKANTATKVLLPTGDRKQFAAMAESMHLSDRQAEVAQQLDVGQAIVQAGNRDPVPVTLRDYRVDKTVTDEQLREAMTEKWDDLAHEDREFTPEFELEVGFGASGEGKGEGSGTAAPELDHSGNRVDQSGIELSGEADRLLEDIVENPFEPLTGRYDRFSSSYKGNKAKNELVDAGVVVERHVRTRNGKRKLLELTEKGREYATQELDLAVERTGRGGIVHRYWQHRIADAFEAAGWDATVEHHDADVYVDVGSTGLAVEVAMGNNPREVEHVEQHLEAGFVVWVACRNEEVRDGLRQRLEENGLLGERVVFRLFRDFDDVEEAAG